MQFCYQQYHVSKEVIDSAETLMIQDLEGDAGYGLIRIDYNARLNTERFKVRLVR